jgi:hypothetical protein
MRALRPICYSLNGVAWGGADLVFAGNARLAYIKALQNADAGDFKPLHQFVRS